MVLNKEPRDHPRHFGFWGCDSNGPTNQGYWDSCLSQWGKKQKWKKIKLEFHLMHPDGTEHLYV